MSPTYLLHEPAMADDDRLTGQRVRAERGEEQRGLGDIPDRGEFTVHGFLQHDFPDYPLLRYSQFPGLLRNLLVDKGGAHETGTNDVGPDAVFGTFFGD